MSSQYLGKNMAGLTDEELALAAQDGCEDASGLLITRCADMIQKQALRLRSDWIDAEDLAQEGFLGLLSAIRTYRREGGASFRTYASVCIRHRMVSALKRSCDSGHNPPAAFLELDSMDQQDEMSPPLADGQADPAQAVIQREETERLRSRLREILTDLEYEVLMLYLGAYTYEEIAQRLQISSKAVDNALQRIRRKLSVGSFSESG